MFDIYEKGYNDAIYGYSYLDPYWTANELAEWARGYKDGKAGKWNF